MMIDLSGHGALITGASGQLGRVMAKTLSFCGARIAIHYHSNERAALQLRDEIERSGGKACVVQADIGSFDEMTRMKESLPGEFGSPDIIVANAVSQIDPWKNLLDEEISDYEDQFRSCVLHNVFLAKLFVPAMIAKGWGRYIGINTECAMQCDVTQSAYASAKRGMDGILRVLAKEVGEHAITVNQVAPGWTVSERDRREHTETRPEYEAQVPLRRRGTDQEIANVVAFLASDLASFITGAYVPVCGGSIMPTI